MEIETDDPSSTCDKEPRITIKKWNAVAIWSYDLKVDTCAICRNHIMDLCIECQTSSQLPDSSPCTVAWGECEWLEKRDACPLDNQKWTQNKEYT